MSSDASAARVNTDGSGAARGVTWRVGSTGSFINEDARVVVMACGAIESPRLWLNSGFPNANGWVGRGLTDHFLVQVNGMLPASVAPAGPASAARVDYPGFGMFESAIMTPADAAQALMSSDAGSAGFHDKGFAGTAQGADRRAGS